MNVLNFFLGVGIVLFPIAILILMVDALIYSKKAIKHLKPEIKPQDGRTFYNSWDLLASQNNFTEQGKKYRRGYIKRTVFYIILFFVWYLFSV